MDKLCGEDNELKRIAILGSTGSIGQQTLEIVRLFPERFQVVGLAAGKNTQLLSKQVKELHPRLVWFQDAEKFSVPPTFFGGENCELATPEQIASCPQADLIMIATSGKSGLLPTLAAIRAGKKIALANKEVLVMAGEIVVSQAKRYKAEIFPVDSEHSAIWQCLRGEQHRHISRLILTSSGGPFRQRTKEELAAVTPEEALQHPTWQMGKKVTIDSATLMNKGMEVIEAHWLFDIPLERIEVVIHPESIVHSLVEFVDGAVKAQLSLPDMRLPILYALSFPERLPNPHLPQLGFPGVFSLNFGIPDSERFPCLRLAREAGEKAGTYPAVLCAADEIAIELFLSHRIGFRDVARIVQETLMQHEGISHPSLKEILAADAWARTTATRIASRLFR